MICAGPFLLGLGRGQGEDLASWVAQYLPSTLPSAHANPQSPPEGKGGKGGKGGLAVPAWMKAH